MSSQTRFEPRTGALAEVSRSQEEIDRSPANVRAFRTGFFNDSSDVTVRESNFDVHHGPVASVVVHIDNRERQTTPRRTSSPITPSESNSTPSTLPIQLSTASRPSNVLYEEHMMLKGRGYPLWCPQANMRLPNEYRSTGVCIGDVGIINPEGSFDFLFNILHPPDCPIQPSRLPDGFAPLAPGLDRTDIREYKEFGAGVYLASASIEKSLVDLSGLTFESTASEGAVLTMPDGAYRMDLSNVEGFREYVAKHAESWYRFCNGPRGRRVENGQIRLVTGHHKTTTWGMATFSNVPHPSNFRLKFRNAQNGSQGQSRYSWEHTGMAEVKVGPDADEHEGLSPGATEPLRNQCLFLRTMNATLADDLWEKVASSKASGQTVSTPTLLDVVSSMLGNPVTAIVTTALLGPIFVLLLAGVVTGMAQQTLNEGNSEEHVVIGEQETQRAPHPSNVIHKILLHMYPTAKMAITTDTDWQILLPENWKSLTLESLTDILKIGQNIAFHDGIVYLLQRHACESDVPPNALKRSTRVLIPTQSSSRSEDPAETAGLLLDVLASLGHIHRATYQPESNSLSRTNRNRQVFATHGPHPLRLAILDDLGQLLLRLFRDYTVDELIRLHRGALLKVSVGGYNTLVGLVVTSIALQRRYLWKRHSADRILMAVYLREVSGFNLDTILIPGTPEHQHELLKPEPYDAEYLQRSKWRDCLPLIMQANHPPAHHQRSATTPARVPSEEYLARAAHWSKSPRQTHPKSVISSPSKADSKVEHSKDLKQYQLQPQPTSGTQRYADGSLTIKTQKKEVTKEQKMSGPFYSLISPKVDRRRSPSHGRGHSEDSYEPRGRYK